MPIALSEYTAVVEQSRRSQRHAMRGLMMSKGKQKMKTHEQEKFDAEYRQYITGKDSQDYETMPCPIQMNWDKYRSLASPDPEEREAELQAMLAEEERLKRFNKPMTPEEEAMYKAVLRQSPYYESWRRYPILIGSDLLLRFLLTLLMFPFTGWIGWLGLILISLRFLSFILWPWWVAALPLEYGVLYCLYMTIDGALYRAGLKGVGRYAQYTSGRDKYGMPLR